MSVGSLISLGSKLIDKIIPDPAERARAKTELLKAENEESLRELNAQMSTIVMEAQSKDPWTSRARPGFLYVMYIMILFSIPMGVLHAQYPAVAADVTTGVKDWLSAIPGEMWTLFGAGYLGYVKKRSDDKSDLLGVKKRLF